MIINCPCGEKKFEVDSNLIPEKGRMLKCGSCDQTWFYNPTRAIKSDISQEIEPEEKPKLPENIVLYCVVQTDEEQLTIICKHALDCTNKDNLISLVFFREIDQLVNSFNESISNSRSGNAYDNFNSLYLL